VVIPLLMAAFLTATSPLTSRRVVETVAIATSAVVTVLCALLLVQAIRAPIVYWFGGWWPRGGFALGISFVIDPMGAALAALAAVLMTAALVFSWRYFATERDLYHVIMLTFLAGMVGFSLTGDLFDMFVFFELLSVAAFSLTGYEIEETGPLQGALTYTLIASIGAALIVSGIALLYARTSALNLAQIGRALAGHAPDNLVIAAFVLVTVGFFIKAAVVPFHFWLPDVETVAPNPVCAIFSGALVALGVYGVARVYWTIFAGTLGAHAADVRAILVAVSVLTALVGALMCPLQRNLKRLLAFSTVAHVGIFMMGVALLTPVGLDGAAFYILTHAPVKAALFLCVGILWRRFDSVDEHHLRGRGRDMVGTGLLFALGGLSLAGLPPITMFLGKGMIEDSANAVGYPWVTAVLVVASILTGGAVLRAAGSVFLGWGVDDTGRPCPPQTDRYSGRVPVIICGRVPVVVFAPPCVLMAGALILSGIPQMGPVIEVAAARFQDRAAYAALVLDGVTRHASLTPLPPVGPTLSIVLAGLGSTAGAVAVALLALFRWRLPMAWRRAVGRPAAPGIAWLRRLQSGYIRDYIAWLTLGVALLGAACTATLR
jgi:multicomponent Na+:H+ antiporter subunit D